MNCFRISTYKIDGYDNGTNAFKFCSILLPYLFSSPPESVNIPV